MTTIQWRFCVVEEMKEGYVVAATLVIDQLHEEEEEERLEWLIVLGNLRFIGSSIIWDVFGL